jgi:hypothetical protein
MDALAEELTRLNDQRPYHEWLDMIAVADVGVIRLACQLAGQPQPGDILPPDVRALDCMIPAWNVVVTLRPTREGTFNKLAAYIVAWATSSSPGVAIPNFNELPKGVCVNSMMLQSHR